MKTLVLLLATVALGGALRAQVPDLVPGALLIATQDDLKPSRCNSPNWSVEKGEVYRFVRYMTQSEYFNGGLLTKDRSFIVARISGVLVVEPIAQWSLAADAESADKKYKSEVAELDRQDAQDARERAARDSRYNEQQLLEEIRRIRQLEELRLLQYR